MGDDRRIDPATRERLDEIERGYRALAQRNLDAIVAHWNATRLILGAICAFLLILGIVSLVLLNQSSTRATEGKNLAQAIQRSRVDQCKEGNIRHDLTITTLDQEIARLPADRQQQAKASREFTVALINTLAPYRDCTQIELAPTPHAKPRAHDPGARAALALIVAFAGVTGR